MRIVIGCDHGGADLSKEIALLIKSKYPKAEITRKGAESGDDKKDYPSVAKEVCDFLITLPPLGSFGILICGSGIGMSIAANKVNGIRCALVHDAYTAKMARRHNDANVIALGQRVTGSEVAKDAVDIFLKEEFEGGRHELRVSALSQLEK